MHEFSLGLGVHLWDQAMKKLDPGHGVTSTKKDKGDVSKCFPIYAEKKLQPPLPSPLSIHQQKHKHTNNKLKPILPLILTSLPVMKQNKSVSELRFILLVSSPIISTPVYGRAKANCKADAVEQ